MPDLRFYDGQNQYPTTQNDISANWQDGVTVAPTSVVLSLSATDINNGGSVTLTAVVNGGAVTTGSVTFQYQSGSTWVDISTDAANPWSISHSPTLDKVYRAKYLGTAAFGASTSATKSLHVRQLTTKTKTYTCTDTASYYGGDASLRTPNAKAPGSKLKQGGISGGIEGLMNGIIIFPSTIATFFAGSLIFDITKVELFLQGGGTNFGSSGIAAVRRHGASTAPASWPPTGLGSDDDATTFGSYAALWCDLSNGIAGILTKSNWSGGTYKGCTVTPPTGDPDYFCSFEGFDSAAPPQLRFTYREWV